MGSLCLSHCMDGRIDSCLLDLHTRINIRLHSSMHRFFGRSCLGLAQIGLDRTIARWLGAGLDRTALLGLVSAEPYRIRLGLV